MKKILFRIAIALIVAVLIMPYSTQASQVHRVAPGESLYLISQRYGVTMEEIIARNDLRNPETIFVNQPLILPVKEKSLTSEATYNVLPEPHANYSISQLARQFPDTFYLKGSANSNRIALTFDDGPDGIYTPQVLDVLKEYHVPATFFLMGSRAEKHPDVVKRIVDEGHIVGNHSWSHPNLSKVSTTRLIDETISTENILTEITGLRTALMRPPYGAVSKSTIEELKKMDYKVINWSVDSVDWRDQDAGQILNNTLPDVTDEAILLFHSASGEGKSMAATVEVLPELIEILREQGYTFVTVDELLDTPAYR